MENRELWDSILKWRSVSINYHDIKGTNSVIDLRQYNIKALYRSVQYTVRSKAGTRSLNLEASWIQQLELEHV